MPDSTPVRLDLDQALDETLQGLFHRLQCEPASDVLIRLVDELEAAYGRARAGERRTIPEREGA